LDEPLPVGMGLHVNIPDQESLVHPPPSLVPGLRVPGLKSGFTPAEPEKLKAGPDGLCDFDEMDIRQVCGFVDTLYFSSMVI